MEHEKKLTQEEIEANRARLLISAGELIEMFTRKEADDKKV